MWLCDVRGILVCVQVALQEGLENVQNFFQRNSCRLPLSPSLVAKELNVKVMHAHTCRSSRMRSCWFLPEDKSSSC